MAIPFPVSPEYRIRATVRPLARALRPDGDAERGLFDPGDSYLQYVDAKLRALRGDTPCRRVAGELSAAHGRVLRTLCERIQAEQPGRLQVSGEDLVLPTLGLSVRANFINVEGVLQDAAGEIGERIAAHLESVSARACLLDAIGLAIEEDYVFLEDATETDLDCAKILHVCLPSGWSASDKVGMDFSAIHVPVPHNTPLMAAHHGLVGTLVRRPPFVRYVWGLHRDDALCHDPHVHQQPPEARDPTAKEAAACSWFRVERQTTFGLPEENGAFFFIRVYQVPLVEAVTSRDRATTMAAALADMTPELAAYKGVTHRRKALIEWLNERANELG